MSKESNRANEEDAVCFTAGPAGAFFSAGVIHAHLAADRPAPAIVAGISTGAISAAAMQRAYKKFFAARDQANAMGSVPAEQTEAGRWVWIRKYIAMLVDKPANVFWDSLPNPTDFFADQNAPSLRDLSLAANLQQEQIAANRQKYLLTNLGVWLAMMPLRVSTLTTALVRFVRFKEGYTGNWLSRRLEFYWSLLVILLHAIWHTVFHAVFVNESIFEGKPVISRPLLGWRVYLSAWAFTAPPVAVALLLVSGHLKAAGVLAFFAVAAFVAGLTLFRKPFILALRKVMLGPLLASVGFGRSLLSHFPMRWRLQKIFEEDDLRVTDDGKLGVEPMPALLVVAPLQTLYQNGKPVSCRQLWARPGSGIKVVDAISAALALPGLWPPWSVDRTTYEYWGPLRDSDPRPRLEALDLVDGSAVRQNPLPALLDYLRRHGDISAKLERKVDGQWTESPRPSIHVVYSVPLSGPPGEGRVRDKDANIIDVAITASELGARRDTRMEVDQLMAIARLEIEVRSAGGETPLVAVATADQIAPPADPAISTEFRNPLSPGPDQALKKVAEGCRRTLEKLYEDRLALLPTYDGGVPCRELLREIATERPWHSTPPLSTGLPEVCEQCTGKLRQPKKPAEPSRPSLLKAGFDNLLVSRPVGGSRFEAQPRIVFVWSGGVFRGSFHIGMIGALLKAKIKPDLIAAASVGTLMGGALAAMFSATDGEWKPQLKRLVSIFREVDNEVALTRTLKEAARDLGTRGRQIRLSPSMVRRTVLRGTQADAGFAASGAPPALIDAISSLLSIPLDETRNIAGKFIAGQVAEAAHSIVMSIKEHTLARLNIETAVLGASLLERRALELFQRPGVELDHGQPFWKAKIAILATATNLGAQSQVVLWDDLAQFGKPFDFLHAALASSAFPSVFAPRRACEVFPGWGRPDIRYSDGGMFDNLPFMPAVAALSRVQMEESEEWKDDAAKMKQYVADRHNNPDLFLTGALNANPEDSKDRDGPFKYFNDISSRAVSLGNNSKIHSLINSAALGYRQFGNLKQAISGAGSTFKAFKNPGFVRRYVNAAVLPVFPTDVKHINPTFAFCKSTGMDPKILMRSIADGCYQTFRSLSEAQQGKGSVRQSLDRLNQCGGRVPLIRKTKTKKPASDGFCPFFHLNAEKFACPFAEAGHKPVHDLCRKDPAHRVVSD